MCVFVWQERGWLGILCVEGAWEVLGDEEEP